MIQLVVAGLSFRTAPVEVRERATVAAAEAPQILRYLVGHAGLRAAAVLSTCNRTEFYVICPDDSLAAEVGPRLGRYLDAGGGSVEEHIEVTKGTDAVRHMARVAAGLDSMVVGEAQVLGQFKAAHRIAREAGTLDARLDFVMRRAVSVGKRVRTETGLGRWHGDLSGCAVAHLAEATDLDGAGALVVGAGTMSALAADHLARRGARVHVMSRSGISATRLATAVGGTAVASSDLARFAPAIDVMVTATNSAEAVLTAADLGAFQGCRGHRPLWIADIAVPRDVDAAAASIPGVNLADIDGLADCADRAMADHRGALLEAEAIVAAAVASSAAALTEPNPSMSAIAMLSRHAEAVRQRELERTAARLPQLDPELRERVELLTLSLVRKLLHGPISRLREAADDPSVALALLDAFDLDGELVGLGKRTRRIQK